MQKIITMFQRNYETDRLVRDEITPGAEWVVAGEGKATRKWDGTCCMVRDGKLYKRYDVKKGRVAPPNFEPAQEPDEITGHHPGWIPVVYGPEDTWHQEGFSALIANCKGFVEIDGTYELVGPKVQGNPEQNPRHQLIRHGCQRLPDAPRTFDGLREWFKSKDIEGIVWHHPDGRMVKIKKKDFGLKR